MIGAIESQLRFEGFQVTEINYISPVLSNQAVDDAPDYVANFEKKLTKADDRNVTISLKCNLWVGESMETAPFRLAVEMAGFFSAEPAFEPSMEKNALAILFPYLRAYVTSITVQSSRPPVVLPALNIAAMFDETAGAKTESK